MRGEQGDIALTRAAQTGQLETVVSLLRSGAIRTRATARDCRRSCSLRARDTREVMVALLRAGADPNGRTRNGQTPLMFAADERTRGRGERAAENGAKVDEASLTGQTALMYAAWKGRVRAIFSLVAAGAKVNEQAEDGQTALIRAVREGQLEAARVLLKSGAIANVADRAGWTPLLYASAAGHGQLALLLLEKGADPNAKGVDGRTPLMLASLLPERQRRRRPRRDDSNKALVKAARDGHASYLRSLLAKGAQPDTRDENGWTPLIHASAAGHDEIVQFLLERGADPSARTVGRHDRGDARDRRRDTRRSCACSSTPAASDRRRARRT